MNASKPRRGGSRQDSGRISLAKTSIVSPEQVKQLRSKRGLRPVPTSENRGMLVVFFSAHGGTGSTTLATNVGAIHAAAGRPTCMVDFDLQFGHVLTHLGLHGHRPLSHFAGLMQGEDDEMATATFPRHHSGLCALSQVGHMEELGQLDAQIIEGLVNKLTNSFELTIIDGIRDFSDHALAVLDRADRIVLVATQDVPAIRGVQMRLKILRQLNYDTSKVMLVLNRYSKGNQVTLSAIEEALGIAPSMTIVNDFKRVHGAINGGQLLAEVSRTAPVTRQVERLAQLFLVADAPIPAPRSARGKDRSLWSRIVRRHK
ncbi:MAG: hypothetical protein IT371_03640 [Deltaproteobacteria bacterium]|nr:hypothetical protein [Deltaproteobacteria bacterium]